MFRGTDQENSTSHLIKELTVCAGLVLQTEFQFLLKMKKIMTYFRFAHSQKEKNERRIGRVFVYTTQTQVGHICILQPHLSMLGHLSDI